MSLKGPPSGTEERYRNKKWSTSLPGINDIVIVLIKIAIVANQHSLFYILLSIESFRYCVELMKYSESVSGYVKWYHLILMWIVYDDVKNNLSENSNHTINNMKRD